MPMYPPSVSSKSSLPQSFHLSLFARPHNAPIARHAPAGPPPPPADELEALVSRLEAARGPDHAAMGAMPPDDLRRVIQELADAWELEATIAERDGRALQRLRASAERRAAAFALVPELPEDVHDLRSLTSVAQHLGVVAVDGDDLGSTY